MLIPRDFQIVEYILYYDWWWLGIKCYKDIIYNNMSSVVLVESSLKFTEYISFEKLLDAFFKLIF